MRPSLSGLGWGRAGRLAVVALVAVLAAAAPAAATSYCVGFERAGCEGRATAALAFADAGDGDRIELGAITTRSALSSERSVTVTGAGEDETDLHGGLTLSSPEAQVSGVTVHGLKLGGAAARVVVEGVAELHGDAALRAATVRGDGGVDAIGGNPRLASVLLNLTGGPGLRVHCATTLHARHVTLVGRADALVTTDACASAVARLSDSILWGEPGNGFAGGGQVVTAHSDYRPIAGHAAGAGDRSVDPGFVRDGAELSADSALVDAGAPDPLSTMEWPEDRQGLPRIADGNGDGVLARDPGAFERAPDAVPLPPHNLLRDPGGEDGGAWHLSGGFARVRYGKFPFPSAAAGDALGAGGTFFAGGVRTASAAEQVVSVARLAPEIDGGSVTATLTALLGGYRRDADRGVVVARFLDPSGRSLGKAALDAPTARERAQVTGLLARSRRHAVPPLTRSIAVTLRATRAARGYTDAYFDNVALTVVPAPPKDPEHPSPFAGVRVLTRTPTVDRKGRIPVLVACADATVGRCSGMLTLAGALRRGARPHRLSARRVSLAPGAARWMRIPLGRTARSALRRRERIRMRLFAAVRDGQRVTWVSTVPVTVRARRGR